MRPLQPLSADHALSSIRAAPALADLARAIRAGGRIAATGAHGSSTTLVAAAASSAAQRPFLLVTAHLDDADDAADELIALGVPARRLPAMELVPGESNISLELFAERLSIVRWLLDGGFTPHGIPAPAPGTPSPKSTENPGIPASRSASSAIASDTENAASAPPALVCSVQSLMQPVPAPSRLPALVMPLKPGDATGPSRIVRWLDDAGYRRADAIEEPGDYAVRGGILDVFPPGADAPVRLDFFGDELESISEVDLATLGSDRRLASVELIGVTGAAPSLDDGSGVSLLSLIDPAAVAFLHETAEVTEQARGYYERVVAAGAVFAPPAVIKLLQDRFHAFVEVNQFSPGAPLASARIDLPVRALPAFSENAAEAVEELARLAAAGEALVFCQNDAEVARLGELVREFAPTAPLEHIRAGALYLHRGFLWDSSPSGGAFVPHAELLHRYHTRRRVRRLRAGRAMDSFLEIDSGDFVVHADHGVAKFLGLRTMKRKPPPGAPRNRQDSDLLSEEFLTLEFAGKALLHVPSSQIDKVQKYVGGFKGKPPLSSLGGKRWQQQKERVSEAVRDLAAEMLRIQAAREHMPGVRYPADTPWQKEFEAEFPYDETEDQLAALAEIKRDMSSARPMDRLLCGDVGFGKTELAIRAAFKAAEYGKQVAILVPTTVLAEQHERTFRERFADYPFKIESLSRFKTAGEQKTILEAVRKGQVDIVIGTHRLLSADVRFADLGLVVVDEEQRFGVEHKHRLLSLRMTVDVLTLSATPIPRTLHMSLLGIRDISSLATPPMDRRAIVTEVIPWNEKRLAQSIARELAREGQVFFVHNRVHNIRTIADHVHRLAPGARVVIGHGQMPAHELEQVMLKFVRRQADILVCTTIIESGVDIPTANTMIINDADRFGLADLHQLRGRVGRHKHRAYCYMLLPETRAVSPTARRRLKAIEEFSMLGAGFKIAMRDLEIRGAGNLLGAEQSGHIATVGYEMYCRLLDRAVRELRSEVILVPAETTVDIGIAGLLPKAYIPSDLRRMEAYRRLALASTIDELRTVERDLADAYGKPPKAAERLLALAEIRIGARTIGVRSLVVQERDVILRCEAPAPITAAFAGAQGTVRPLPPKSPGDLHEVYFRPPENFLAPESLLTILRHRLSGTHSADRAPESPARKETPTTRRLPTQPA